MVLSSYIDHTQTHRRTEHTHNERTHTPNILAGHRGSAGRLSSCISEAGPLGYLAMGTHDKNLASAGLKSAWSLDDVGHLRGGPPE